MAREITSVKDAEPIDSVEKPSTFNERLVKLIPSEIITAYVTISGLIGAFNLNNDSKVLWAVIVILMIMTPVYLNKISHVTKKGQLLYSMLGFIIWALATHPPKGLIEYCNETPITLLTSIALILYTMCIPLLYKG